MAWKLWSVLSARRAMRFAEEVFDQMTPFVDLGVEIEPQRAPVRLTRRIPIAALVNPAHNTEFYIRIASNALKIAASFGECGLKAYLSGSFAPLPVLASTKDRSPPD